MSGRIGGRSNVAHEPSPVAVSPPLLSALQVGSGTCTAVCTGIAQTGYNDGATSTTPNGSTERDATPPVLCPGGTRLGPEGVLAASDMVVSLAVTDLPALSGSPGRSVTLGARCTSSVTGGAGYFLLVEYSAARTNCAVDVFGPDAFTLIASAFPVAVAPGDTFSLSVIGTAVVAKHNGGIVHSLTDSSLAGSDALTFGGYEVSNAGGSAGDIIISDFAVTPVCP